MSELTVCIGRHLLRLIPIGGVRTAVCFTPDEKCPRDCCHPAQSSRKRDRLRRPLSRRFADDIRQPGFTTISGNDLSDDQHVGTSQAAIEPVNGKDIFSGFQLIVARGDVERLELDRH